VRAAAADLPDRPPGAFRRAVDRRDRGACGCNLYGNDGSSLWLTVLTPGPARADVRGRQLAWLIVVAPFAVVSTIVLTLVGGEGRYWTWTPALLATVLGGGAGLAAIGSLVAVEPLDEAGNPTPARSLEVHVALVAVARSGVAAGAGPVRQAPLGRRADRRRHRAGALPVARPSRRCRAGRRPSPRARRPHQLQSTRRTRRASVADGRYDVAVAVRSSRRERTPSFP
jgi:hypothetical protein